MPTINQIPCFARHLVAISALLSTCTAVSLGGPLPPSNDECFAAAPVFEGVNAFDLNGATAGGSFDCDGAPFAQDVWFCWTAPCTGVVHISTCGQTEVDTKIAFYDSCNCGGLLLCCNDDFAGCAPQSSITCSVVAGNPYLIQLGTPPGVAPGTGTLSIACAAPGCPGNDFCPVDSLAENEICGTDTNGGCNQPSTNPAEPISCGDTICATFWYDGTFRDTDWYEFTILVPSRVWWRVYADVPVDAFILSAGCAPTFYGTTSGDCPVVVDSEICLPPGTYRTFVAPSFSGPIGTCFDPQGGWFYLAELECEPCYPCGDPNAGSCFVVHPTPSCNDALCCEVVCSIDPFCCQIAWDIECVRLAVNNTQCYINPGGDPPCPNANVYLCEEGCRDDFDLSNGTEPATGTTVGCVPFDVIPTDGCFQHTLSDCWPSCPEGCGANSCGTIVGAYLEIRMQGGPSGAPIDPVDLVTLTNNGLPVWSGAIAPGTGVSTTVVLNLANLPISGANILNTLCDGELGVEVADDTGVDYISLTVIHCPCDFPFRPFFERDDSDDITTPSPTTPSAQLMTYLNLCSSGPLLQYDVIASNQCFGETIDNLPSCILGAYLAIGVIPSSDPLQSNDGLALEVIDECGKTFAWSMSLANLQAAGHISPPLSAGNPSVITLLLQDLPPDAFGTRNILSHLLDGSLDIFIQDDTGVDFIFLGPDVCNCCKGDIDGDSDADIDDLFDIISAWGPCPQPCPPTCSGDTDGDCDVDIDDLFIVIGHWGPC